MKNHFDGWEKFSVDDATVDFYKKDKFIGFDSSKCVPPEPMVNAIIALKFLPDRARKVIMINHKFPIGLIKKIENSVNYEKTDLENGLVKLEFSLKDGMSLGDIKADCKG
ncbi:hypothetical protein [Campylobacter corcagiensis]|uniref:DUF2249 domain-containing protein n=1 Tax=Campylobacter corcagiensis TaxID=1448857 RepID=A0A7M1LH12_9BACT|nr:hypothetical protein [Campylobacter corcagiensis]QKF65065.1 hypothetical protein CCORG_1216 [Campylobacter corcagiensis]QOQ86785.1 hypothetical protein IMC76_06080 [Campylobacter corcagiensis]